MSDVAGNCLTGGLDLTTGEPSIFQCFYAEGSKSQLMSATREPLHPSLLLSSELSLFWL